VLLATSTLAFWLIQSRQTIRSLAVLPFANADGDPDVEYLGEGLAEHLINSLSQNPKLRVIARSVALRYKGPQEDSQRAGRDLNVRAVLTGRVLERDGALNIQVDLIDVENGSQLWGRQYSCRFSDVLGVQREISEAVAEKLGAKATVEHKKRLAKRSTEDTEAYQAYLRGRYYWNRRSEQALRRAVGYFQQAIDKDPGYALAWAGLADCYAAFPGYHVESPRESGPKAKAAAAKALEIDNTLAEAHAAMAVTSMHHDWDWSGAEREFQLAIQLDPNYATSYQWYSECLTATGRTEQALASIKRAQQLDPLSPSINTNLGTRLHEAGRYDEAIEQLRKVVEMEPSFAPAHWFLGMPYLQKEMYREAIAEFQRAVQISGGNPAALGRLGYAYAISGNREKAQQSLAELDEVAKRRYVAPIETAGIYAGLADRERALEWLEKAVLDRSRTLIFLKVDHRFDALRNDPRFSSLLRRIGLEP
jgi:TolB-like protein/Flp pilus assembly protein TadD